MTPSPAPNLRNLVRFGLPGLVLAMGLLLTLGTWSRSRSAHQRQVHAYFDYRSRDAGARVEARLHQYEQVLLDARGLFQANASVSRKQFADFVSSVEVGKRHPGIQGIGFALVVPAAELEQHHGQIRREGFPEYRVRPEGQRALYTSIIYLEPFAERNLRAFGYDMFSEPVRQEAMRRAMDSGDPALSGKVQLVQETDQAIQAGFLLYVPVYRNGRATLTVEDRRRNLMGWVYAPFRMNDFMHGVLGEGAPDLDLEIYDGPGALAETRMFDLHPVHALGAATLPQEIQTQLFAGHSWTVMTQAMPGLITRQGRDTSSRVLGLGSLVSLLLGLTVYLLARHLEKVRTLNATLEQRVQERTQALAERELHFRILVDHTYGWELWEDPSGALLYCSPSCDPITSCPAEAFLTDPGLLERLVHPEDRLSWKAHRATVEATTGGPAAALVKGGEFKFRLVRPDGEVRWIGHICHPIHDAEGRFLGHRISNRDITERIHAEAALQESERRFRLMSDHAPVLIWISGQDQLCTYFNQVWLDFTGRTLAQELGQGWAEGVHPDDRQRCLDTYGDHFEQRLEFTMDFRLRHADGSYRWLADHGLPRFDAEGIFQGYIGSCVEITGRKQAEEALRLSEQQLLTAQQIGQSGSWIYEVATGAVWGSAEGLRIFGFAPVAGAFPLADFLACLPERERVHQALEALLSEGRDYNLEFSVNPADGASPRIIHSLAHLEKDAQGNPLRVLGYLLDITERKHLEAAQTDLEARNHKLQKAESLGLMAASIAHHFNNKLQAVMASLDMLSALPKGGDPTHYLAMARLSSEKAAAVSRQMLVYLGNSPGVREPLFLGELCAAILPYLQQGLPGGITLTSACPVPGPVIKANAEQLQEILTNLVTNAWEAMGATGGCVRLNLGTFPVPVLPTEHRFPVGWQAQESEYACLEIADTGAGIASPDIEKLFDPFYSTKFTGRGLGLSVVLGLVQAHGGALTVASQLGQGSVFRVFLPLSAEAPPSPWELDIQAPEHESGGTLLLVDDDGLLLRATGALVELLGYSLITAQDGVEALEVFRQHQGEIRCVVTDLTMPRRDGWGLLTALRELDPNLPVILASGYDQAQVLAGEHPDQPQAVLSKPFNLQQLRDALGQALGTHHHSGQ